MKFLCLITCPLWFAHGVHDSLNFVIPPKKRECVYEDFLKIPTSRTVEAFVQSGGNLDISLQVVFHPSLFLD